jgi:hypothetical protein
MRHLVNASRIAGKEGPEFSGLPLSVSLRLPRSSRIPRLRRVSTVSWPGSLPQDLPGGRPSTLAGGKLLAPLLSWAG